MWRISLALTLALATLARGNIADKYYQTLGCSPSWIEDIEGNPVSYNCSVFDSLKRDECFYEGKNHPLGSNISGEDFGDGCTPKCQCVAEEEVGAAWRCDPYECPEYRSPASDCTDFALLYSVNNTCCPDFECERAKKIHRKQVGTCEYDGKTYIYGELIDLPSSKCLTCLCMEGFNATNFDTSPLCKRQKCFGYVYDDYFLKRGCVPTFFDPQDCCPGPPWRCPDEDNLKIQAPEQSGEELRSNLGSKCHFGNYKLQIGQTISGGMGKSECIKCSCAKPPHVTCMIDQACWYKGTSSGERN